MHCTMHVSFSYFFHAMQEGGGGRGGSLFLTFFLASRRGTSFLFFVACRSRRAGFEKKRNKARDLQFNLEALCVNLPVEVAAIC